MNTYIETTLPKWEDIFRINKFFLSPFIYRGQREKQWQLETSLERTVEFFKVHSYTKDYSTDEKWMLHEFIRKYNLYHQTNINGKNYLDWLAIMQHYGAPTRLLDFSESIFIASYFAIVESNSDSAIWAINRHKLRDNLVDQYDLPYRKRHALKDEVNRHQTDFINKHIAREYSSNFEYPTTIVPVEPIQVNERLSRQQGLFLVPTNPKEPFNANLEKAFNRTDSVFEKLGFEDFIKKSYEKKWNEKVDIIKIIIPKELNSEIIKYLHQMNITAELLFPGIEGLAQSLFQTQVRKYN